MKVFIKERWEMVIEKVHRKKNAVIKKIKMN